MNIFELIASDPAGYQRASIDMSVAQRNWTLFKQTVTQLSPQSTKNISVFPKNTEMWIAITTTSPEITTICIDYYMHQLDKIICEQALGKEINPFKSHGQIHSKMQTVFEIFKIHSKFISIFDTKEGLYLKLFQSKLAIYIHSLQIKNKLTEMMEFAYKKHCLNILAENIIQFDESTLEYVNDRCKSAQNGILNFAQLRSIFDTLQDVGLLGQYFEPISNMLNKDNEQHIKATIDFSTNSEFITKCLNYQRTFQKSFLRHIKSTSIDTYIMNAINALDDNTYFLSAKFCCEHILDIVLSFPDSCPTIMALKKCLDHTSLLGEVADHLLQGIQKRLLIPGVLTENILNQYINMLTVLQILDPQGIIFELITAPIKNYLLRRNDTLRCIISHLTDDVENYSKLTRQVVKIPSKDYIQEQSSDEDENAAKEWQILPVSQSKAKVRVKYLEIDLVTVLVGLYGSQEAFISEYQNMMAEKLMSVRDYNIEEEIKNIELLKMRFGESPLQTCNIIVKDVKDSKRNDNVIHKQAPPSEGSTLSLQQMNCLTVSKGYWPINYQTNTNAFLLPEQFAHVFKNYSTAFSKIKAMRKMSFHYNLGFVNLTLHFDNVSIEVRCLPIQAVMINSFDEENMRNFPNGISSEQLSNKLNVPQNIIKQKMSFWVHKGVVKEIRLPKANISMRRINSVEDGELIWYKPVKEYHQSAPQIGEAADSALVKESTSLQSHLRHIIQGLIVTILNTNGPKTPEKIHLLLKTVYRTDLDYTYGEIQTVDILKKMSQKKKIHFNGETYSSKLH